MSRWSWQSCTWLADWQLLNRCLPVLADAWNRSKRKHRCLPDVAQAALTHFWKMQQQRVILLTGKQIPYPEILNNVDNWNELCQRALTDVLAPLTWKDQEWGEQPHPHSVTFSFPTDSLDLKPAPASNAEVDDEPVEIIFREDTLWERWDEEWQMQRDETPERDALPYVDWCGSKIESQQPSVSLPSEESTSSVLKKTREKKPKEYRWGSCPVCSSAVSPVVPNTGRFRGQHMLRCNAFNRFGPDRKRRCWHARPFEGDVNELPRFVRQKRKNLASNLPWQFGHGFRWDTCWQVDAEKFSQAAAAAALYCLDLVFVWSWRI